MPNTGQKLYQKAKKLIPGGTQLLSKRPEIFLPDLWPSYYQKAKGCQVWDLDGRSYYDFAQMGVGSCTLGYAHDAVNATVKDIVDQSSMCTLNAPEEVQLAETLIELHPWAEQARFARTGGEACSIATRIARAATGRSKIAFCGYHGWHDWYLSANLKNESALDKQLLPGLDPNGVPNELANTALPFQFNDLPSLEVLLESHPQAFAAIYLEPQRGDAPDPDFLPGVRKLATKHQCLIIFDEITSGFRVNLGGIHLTHGVDPDIAVFGKALGNGFPIAAIIGRRSAMEAAQSTFVSSTFWTERIGPAAAVATLEAMRRENTQAILVERGRAIQNGWNQIARECGLAIGVSGIPPLAHIHFHTPDPLAAQTYYAQAMLDKGYLVGAAVYATQAYTPEIVAAFIEDSRDAFSTLANTPDIRPLLRGPIKHAGFKRLVK